MNELPVKVEFKDGLKIGFYKNEGRYTVTINNTLTNFFIEQLGRGYHLYKYDYNTDEDILCGHFKSTEEDRLIHYIEDAYRAKLLKK